MFSVLLRAAGVSRPLVPASRRLATVLERRTFLTSSPIAFPAAVRPPAARASAPKEPAAAAAKSAKKPAAKKPAVAKKPAAKKPVAKKAAPKKKPVVKKKAAPKKKKKAATKKKSAPKRRVAKKKVAVKKPARVTKAQGPPSRGPTPFIVFANEHRKNNPVGTIVERSVAAGAAWHALSEAEKQPYYAQAFARQAEAAEAVSKYFNNVDPAVLRQLNKQRKARNLKRIINHSLPKRPVSPYVAYYMEHRRRDLPVRESARAAGEAWKALPEAEKLVYRTRYTEQIAVWKEQNTPKSS
ncbi:hypothetical protein B0H12DRAFT_210347 [Mycena haematopus]|nr:hypothetical protein B0H12DRAFT_210347 [Mycena haematopus]